MKGWCLLPSKIEKTLCVGLVRIFALSESEGAIHSPHFRDATSFACDIPCSGFVLGFAQENIQGSRLKRNAMQ